MYRQQAHDLQALEKWLDELIDENNHGLSASKKDALYFKKSDMKRRSTLYDVCMEPLVDQVETHSPALAKLLKRVVQMQTQLNRDFNETCEKQEDTIRSLSSEMTRMVTMSEQQLKRYKHNIQKSYTKNEEYKLDMESQRVSIKILQNENQELKDSLVEQMQALRRLSRRAESELNREETNEAFREIDSALEKLQEERFKALNAYEDMDKLVAQLEVEYAQERKLGLLADDKSCQTEGNIILSESADGADTNLRSTLTDNDDPFPKSKPVAWRLGWNVPFGLRQHMTTFKSSARVMEERILRDDVLHVLWRRASGRIPKGVEVNAVTRNNAKNSLDQSKSFYDAAYCHYRDRHGIASLIDWHIVEFVNSLQFATNDKRIVCMAYYLGIADKNVFNKQVDAEALTQESTLLFDQVIDSDSWCAKFIVEVIQCLLEADIFNESVLTPSEKDEEFSIKLAQASTVASKMCEKWEIKGITELETRLKTASVIHELGGDTRVVTFDDFLWEMTTTWVKFETEWIDILKTPFFQNSKVLKYAFGVMVPCISLNQVEIMRIFKTATSSAHGKYFATVKLDNFREILQKLNIQLNKRQTTMIFLSAMDEMKAERQKRANAMWIEQIYEEGGQSRKYYISQVDNARVWDTQPEFATSKERMFSAFMEEEIDLETFLRVAINNKWSTPV